MYIWSWKDHELKQKIHLGPDGLIPLEVRRRRAPQARLAAAADAEPTAGGRRKARRPLAAVHAPSRLHTVDTRSPSDTCSAAWPPAAQVRALHDPWKPTFFVGAALSSNVIRLDKASGCRRRGRCHCCRCFRCCRSLRLHSPPLCPSIPQAVNGDVSWKPSVAIRQEWTKVEGWVLPELPPLITDIIISLDDKWVVGERRVWEGSAAGGVAGGQCKGASVSLPPLVTDTCRLVGRQGGALCTISPPSPGLLP